MLIIYGVNKTDNWGELVFGLTEQMSSVRTDIMNLIDGPGAK